MIPEIAYLTRATNKLTFLAPHYKTFANQSGQVGGKFTFNYGARGDIREVRYTAAHFFDPTIIILPIFNYSLIESELISSWYRK